MGEIQNIGNYRGQNMGLRGSVYGWGGCCPTLRSNDYKDPVSILVIERKNGQRKTNRNDKGIWQQE